MDKRISDITDLLGQARRVCLSGLHQRHLPEEERELLENTAEAILELEGALLQNDPWLAKIEHKGPGGVSPKSNEPWD